MSRRHKLTLVKNNLQESHLIKKNLENDSKAKINRVTISNINTIRNLIKALKISSKYFTSSEQFKQYFLLVKQGLNCNFV